MATRTDKLQEQRKAALLARMRQGQAVSSGVRSYFKEGLEGVNFWSPKEGDHIIDIIPYLAGPHDPNVKEGDPTYVLEIYIHPDVGGIENQTMICMEKTFKKPCAVCEHRRALQKDGADEDLIKSLQAKRYPRSIYNVVCYDSEKDEAKGIQIFDTSHYLFEMYLLKLAQGSTRAGQRPAGFIPFADPEEGRSIRFTRQGTKENTRYIAHAFEARNYSIPKEILEAAYCLDQLIHIPTYDEVYNAYWGETPANEALPKTSSSGGGTSSSRTANRGGGTAQNSPEPGEPEGGEEENEPPEEQEPDDEAEALQETLKQMDRAGLKNFIAEQGLEIKVYAPKPDGKFSDDWIREEILKAICGTPVKEEEEEPEPAIPPATRGGGGREAISKTETCPGGGTFGKDLNDLPQCEVCTIWDACMTENERLIKQRQSGQERGKATGRAGAGTKPSGGRFGKK